MSLLRLDIEATAGPRDKLRLLAWKTFLFTALICTLTVSVKAVNLHSKNKSLAAELAAKVEMCGSDQSKNQSGASSDSQQSGQGLKLPAALSAPSTSSPTGRAGQ